MRFWILLVLFLALPQVVSAALININTADAVILDTLPGIGPSKAAAIVDYRSKHGLFTTVEDIQKVSGIGAVTFSKLKPYITVGATSTTSAPVSTKPTPQIVSYKSVQGGKLITSSTTTIKETYANAALAPAPAIELAGAGAPITESNGTKLIHSPWIWGLVGVVVFASGAFILL